MKRITLSALIILSLSVESHAQVLISLLFGEKLNSEKIEFGLAGGINVSNTSVPEASTALASFNLGFYFNFLINDKWSFAPAVAVISTTGASNIAPYPIDPRFDAGMVGGSVKRKLEYFQVPLLMRYKLGERFYTTLGPQAGLQHGATDEFSNSLVNKDDLVFNNDIQDKYKRLDFGVAGGFGYRLKKDVPKAMAVGFQFYHGFVDVLKDNPGNAVYNRSLLLYMTLPIGAGKAPVTE